MTRCPTCKNSTWTMADAEVSNTKSRFRSIVCTECTTPLAVVEVQNIAVRLEELEKKIEYASNNVTALAITLNTMASRMR